MQSHLPKLKNAGATVAVVSADDVDQCKTLAKREGFTFSILADPKLKVIDAYGLRHKGASIHGTDIARPAIFLIDKTGKIHWRRLTDNWRVRSRGEAILAQVTALKKAG